MFGKYLLAFVIIYFVNFNNQLADDMYTESLKGSCVDDFWNKLIMYDKYAPTLGVLNIILLC